MQKFVARQNLLRFSQMLEKETNPERRAMLERLIGEETAKLEKAAGQPDDIERDPPGA